MNIGSTFNKNVVILLLNLSRKNYEKANNSLNNVYEYISKFSSVDLQNCETESELSDNLAEAINCYAQYDEYSPELLADEILKVIIDE